MPDEFITRIEYEARNAQTQAEIGKLDAKIDGLSAKIETMNISVSSQIQSIKTDAWKYIATSLISFIGGGGALELLLKLWGK